MFLVKFYFGFDFDQNENLANLTKVIKILMKLHGQGLQSIQANDIFTLPTYENDFSQIINPDISRRESQMYADYKCWMWMYATCVADVQMSWNLVSGA